MIVKFDYVVKLTEILSLFEIFIYLQTIFIQTLAQVCFGNVYFSDVVSFKRNSHISPAKSITVPFINDELIRDKSAIFKIVK